MKSTEQLKHLLEKINGKGYPGYKEVKGSYQFHQYVLHVDHVQGDPFATPSKISITVDGDKGKFPKEFYQKSYQRIALQDYLLRLFHGQVQKYSFKAKGSGKSGLISASFCGQEVLERTACRINRDTGEITIRFEIGFPARGRTIQSDELRKIFYEFLPRCVTETLLYENLESQKVQEVVNLAEDQQFIREELKKRGLIAFIADGSILPRETGISSKPMKNSIPFQSPDSIRTSMNLPNHGVITGMGIEKGITLIVGGGFHGKSTLLKALELGVYNHVAGDGREFVITDDAAVKIRSEDGRSIKNTDISLFINNLPNGKNTISFDTPDASGSTSQAANIVEAMESKTRLFLMDEDTCATNLMIRDQLMQEVVQRDQEPITPFLERVTSLYEKQGISTILVAGSFGAYFHIADLIIQMNKYEPVDITKLAKEKAKAYLSVESEKKEDKEPTYHRIIKKDSKGEVRVKIKIFGKDELQIEKEQIDLRYLEQLVDGEQTLALGYLIAYAKKYIIDGKKSMREVVTTLKAVLKEKGLEEIAGTPCLVSLAMPREQEIFACFNRIRSLKLEK